MKYLKKSKRLPYLFQISLLRLREKLLKTKKGLCMQDSYLQNYSKIYFWQILGFAIQFLNLFFVTPRLTSHQELYGIYSVCFSLVVFLTYSDLGFMGAACKYASENLSRNETEEEIKTVGFASFILLLLMGIFMTCIIVLALNPQILLKNVSDPELLKASSELLWILALTSPIIVGIRIVNLILRIRLYDYISGKLDFLANLARIGVAFLFLEGNRYDIVAYFGSCQLVSLIMFILLAILSKSRFSYKYTRLLKSIRFSREKFHLMKEIAFNTLYNSLMLALFFELDLIILVTTTSDPKILSIFAVSLSFVTYIRFLFDIFFQPFFVRFNHLRGIKNEEGMKELFSQIMIFTLPLTLCTICALFLGMRNFILTWLGSAFENSILIAQIFVLIFIYNFLVVPTTQLLTTEKRIKELYLTNSLNVIVYWAGIILLYGFFGPIIIPILKFVAYTLTGMIFLRFALKFLKINLITFCKRFIFPILLSLIISIIAGSFLIPFLPAEQGTFNLLIVLVAIGGIACSGIFTFFLISKDFRTFLIPLIRQIFFGIFNKRQLRKKPSN